jgi:uncharacterized protein YndB with AHSA1/START domain
LARPVVDDVSVQRFEVFARSSAPPDAVWRWLADASSWKHWTNLTISELECQGAPEPDGVGAIRKLGRAGRVSREQVLEFDAPTHLAYTILSGVPVKDYRADVHLSADGDGTLIAWRASFEPTRPGTGTAIRMFFTYFLRDVARRLASRAAQFAG